MAERELQLRIALARTGLNQDAASAAATIQSALSGIEAQVGVDRAKLEAELKAVEAFTKGRFDDIPVGFSVDADNKLRNELGQFVEVTRRQIEVGLQGIEVDLAIDDRGVKLAEQAIKELADETVQTARQAKFLKDAYNLNDKEVDQLIRKMNQLQAETAAAKKEAGGLNGAIAGLAGGAAFAVIDKLTEAVSAAGEAFVQFIGNTVRLGNEANQSRVAFETILGGADAAKVVLEDLTNFAATTPFEFTGVRQAGQSLLAFNFQAEELEPTLRRIGDVASGVGTDFNELSTIYGKARVQGRLFAEDVNQLTERGIPIIQEFAKQFGVTDAEVKALVESGQIGFPELEQAFISLTSEGGKFFGLMEKQSQEFGGQLSNLSDSVDQFSISLFNAFEPALSGGLETFSAILSEAGEQSGGLDKIAEASERLNQALKDNPELVERLGAALATVFDTGVEQIAAIVDGISDLVSNEDSVEDFAERIEDLAAVIEIVGGTARFIIGLVEAVTSLREQAEGIPIIGEALSDSLSNPIPVLTTLKSLLDGLIGSVQRVLQAFGVMAQEAPQQIKAISGDLNNLASEVNGALSKGAQGIRAEQIRAEQPDISAVEQSAEDIEKAQREAAERAKDAVVEANAQADAAIVASQQSRIEQVKQLQLDGAISAEEAASRIQQAEVDGIAETIAAREAELARYRDLKAQGAISAEELAEKERQIAAEIGDLNIDRLDAELQAQQEAVEAARELAEERKQQAFEVAAAEIEARQEQDLLSARGNLAASLNTLEQERLKTAIAQAKATGDEAGAARLTQQLKAAEVEAEREAFALKRQQLELQIQQNKLEAELALIKARANGASEAEIANLQKQVGLIDELAGLQRQQLDAEEAIAAEKRKQAEFAEIEPPSSESPSDSGDRDSSSGPSISQEERERFRGPKVFSRKGDTFSVNGEEVEENVFRALQNGSRGNRRGQPATLNEDALPMDNSPDFGMESRDNFLEALNQVLLAGFERGSLLTEQGIELGFVNGSDRAARKLFGGPNPDVEAMMPTANPIASTNSSQQTTAMDIRPLIQEIRNLRNEILVLSGSPRTLNVSTPDPIADISKILRAVGDLQAGDVNP